MPRGVTYVDLSTDEFTSLCPVTGQPDFGTITVRYMPGPFIVETKSFKLWLRRFRTARVFNEQACSRIATRFERQSKARGVVVCGEFSPRGGVAVTCIAHAGARMIQWT